MSEAVTPFGPVEAVDHMLAAYGAAVVHSGQAVAEFARVGGKLTHIATHEPNGRGGYQECWRLPDLDGDTPRHPLTPDSLGMGLRESPIPPI